LSAQGIKVFVSHKREDAQIAGQVAARLQFNGLDTYLDVIDDALAKDGPELADHIRARMSSCTQLLAVVTRATQQSWWVPWEIGVATEKGHFLASFVAQQIDLPSYLVKWPYLRTITDVDLYAQESKRAESRLAKSLHTRDFAEGTTRAAAARDFHRVLKSALRQ
jgi:hypothetical protein